MQSMRGPSVHLSRSATLRWAVLAVVLFLLPLASAYGGATATVTSAGRDQLAFVSPQGGSIQIWVMNADGSGRRRLTGPPGQSAIPAWSPDGRRIAFIRSQDSESQIWMMNADGSGQRRLTAPPGSNTFPAWSPDGRRIVFVSTRQGSPQIHVMNADGTGAQRLTDPPGQSTVPVWSPDGRRIAFVSTRDQGVPELYVMNADGSGQKRLSEPESFVTNPYERGQRQIATTGVLLGPGWLHPAWSPDSDRVAFVVRVGRAEQATLIVNADGSGLRRFATGYAPAWSPDGRRMAFVVARVGDAHIYVANVDGSKPTRLTFSGVNLLPSWSPDGRRIAFLASRDGDLAVYIMNTDGSGQHRLASAAGDLSTLPILSWRPRSP